MAASERTGGGIGGGYAFFDPAPCPPQAPMSPFDGPAGGPEGGGREGGGALRGGAARGIETKRHLSMTFQHTKAIARRGCAGQSALRRGQGLPNIPCD